jgi:hypothetical protein
MTLRTHYCGVSMVIKLQPAWLPLFLSLAVLGCETTPQQQIDRAAKLAQKTPFEQIPALYAKLEGQGKLPSEVRKSWTAAWHQQNAQYQKQLAAAQQRREKEEAQRRKMLASMTPAQRAAYELQVQQLALQQRQLAMQQSQFESLQTQAFVQSLTDNMQQQQALNAYNRRTDTYNRPVNVNVYHHGATPAYNVPSTPSFVVPKPAVYRVGY